MHQPVNDLLQLLLLRRNDTVWLLSRTGFASTFRQLSDWTPAQYLTWWRMQLAWGVTA